MVNKIKGYKNNERKQKNGSVSHLLDSRYFIIVNDAEENNYKKTTSIVLTGCGETEKEQIRLTLTGDHSDAYSCLDTLEDCLAYYNNNSKLWATTYGGRIR